MEGWTRMHDLWMIYQKEIDSLKPRKIVSLGELKTFVACKYTSRKVAWFCLKLKYGSMTNKTGSDFPQPDKPEIDNDSEEFHWAFLPGKKVFATLPVNYYRAHCQIDSNIEPHLQIVKWYRNITNPGPMKFFDLKVHKYDNMLINDLVDQDVYVISAGRPLGCHKDL